MKNTPELKKVQDKMIPGAITGEGFLGSDSRTLSDILQKDEEVMMSLGLDWEKVAAALKNLLQKGVEGQGKAVVVDGRWTIVADDTRGRLPCPYGDGLHPKQGVGITDNATGKKYLLSGLNLHLIGKHHFLQGKGSAYRIAPEDLKSLV
jgi:hypothetical protein